MIRLKEAQLCTCKFSELCPGEPGEGRSKPEDGLPRSLRVWPAGNGQKDPLCAETPWEKGRNACASLGAL